jgi:hypothetical protein
MATLANCKLTSNMSEKLRKQNNKNQRVRHKHWAVTLIYDGDGEFQRVYTDEERARKFAARQERSPVVKMATVRSTSYRIRRDERLGMLAQVVTGKIAEFRRPTKHDLIIVKHSEKLNQEELTLHHGTSAEDLTLFEGITGYIWPTSRDSFSLEQYFRLRESHVHIRA